MSSKNKNSEETTSETYALLEKAQQRIKQKKRLYYHFVLFLVGSVFLIIINKFLKVWETIDWFVWAIVFWAFLFVVHAFNVYITHRFLGKAWEEKQREKLIDKQKAKIAEIAAEINAQFPIPETPQQSHRRNPDTE